MKYRISHDWGRTWGDEQGLPAERGWMFRSKPLILDTGEIILPIYDEKTWRSFMMRSADGGITWQFGDMIHTAQGNIHPCVVPLSDGRLLAYLRTGGSGGWIWRTTSSDGGCTWSAAEQTSLPNPNSGIDLIRLRNGHLVLAFNNTARARTPLNVALSEDDGRSWAYLQTIASGPQPDSSRFMALHEYWGGEERATEKHPTEYSYPALLQARDGLIHLVYTDNRVTIRHAIFDEAWLRTGQQWEQRT